MKISTAKFWSTFKKLSARFFVMGADGEGWIRSRPGGYCPICAVVNELTGKEYRNADYDQAALAVGLSGRFADNVAAAADGALDAKTEPIRKKLVTIIKEAVKS